MGAAQGGRPAAGATPAGAGFDLQVVCRGRSADSEASQGDGDAPAAASRAARAAAPRPDAVASVALGAAGAPAKRRGKSSAAAVHPAPPGAGAAAAAAEPASPATPATPATPSSVFDQLDRPRGGVARPRWKRRVAAVLDSYACTVVSIVFTLVYVYADLVRAAFFPPSADPYFLALTIFGLVFFTTEIALSCACRPGYFGRFYSLMDVLSCGSLLCDLPGFMDLVTGNDEEGENHVVLDRAAKAAMAGARAARIMQVIALLSLLRLKARRGFERTALAAARSGLSRSRSASAEAARRGRASVEGAAAEGGGDAGALMGAKTQTRIGEKVTERTMRKVILGTLLLLLVLPVFDADVLYGRPEAIEDGGLVMLHDQFLAEGATPAFAAAAEAYKEENLFKLGGSTTGKLYQLIVANETFLAADPDLRKEERSTAVVRTPECATGPWALCFESKAWVDIKWGVQMQALLDIGRVTFILLMLSAGALFFIRDADELVLQPIERMVNLVRAVSLNPLAHRPGAPGGSARRGSGSGKQLETRVLEQSVTKICSLLSVGFGEAGAEVIADNIRSGGDLNPMVPGRKVRAIFGFCDIRQFTDATEVLQEEVMEFVNAIAAIVHTEVALHGGAANKNIGDAFLLVWKLPPAAAGAEEGAEAPTHLADAALAAFVVVQAALARSPKLAAYARRADLNARMPGFAVRMGFGLHVGWAIEGAIGSRHKIDASYLSPHVNTAARLEAATKQFGAPLLMSGDFARLLSPAVRRRCRQIDRVAVKGSAQPLDLWTYDAAPGSAPPPPRSPTSAAGSGASNAAASDAKQRRGSDSRHAADHETYSDYPYFDEFEEHPDIVASRAADPAFLAAFAAGFELYRRGEWAAARPALEAARALRRGAGGAPADDGPSACLLGVMAAAGFAAPAGWAGHRELTEK
jgi:class 3 adenylate cyclase